MIEHNVIIEPELLYKKTHGFAACSLFQ